MSDLLSRSYVQAGLSVLGLLVVSSIAYFVLSRLRDLSSNDHTLSADLAKNFEEMRREGDIDDKEFRNIQSLLKKETKSSS
ncbi:MAG: hypothetical protein SGI77_27445 [Pirellulaceae bacterium]|nr:hypothetical protein [Pirellulaceae bacterium]